jgi:hypothetical protein
MDVVTVARSQQDGFDIALRRRTDGQRVIDELIVNGAFAMDSEQTFSEQLLAEVLGPTPGAALVAGLGLGYTTSRLLELGATTVDVVEISSALIGWAYEGLTEVLGQIAHDPRVRLHRGDIADVLCAPPTLPGFFGPWDAIALDVDNGPDFLIVAQNERVYHPATLASAMTHLRPGGRLAIWSQGTNRQLWFDLTQLGKEATERLVPLRRGDRQLDYAIYVVTHP